MKTLITLIWLISSSTVLGAWFKGNTHTHTKLSGHGDTPPQQVAQWYHKRGYNFLVLSEHNRFIDPATVKIKNKREDFILIGGVEVSGPKSIHTTALNVDRVVPFRFDSENKSEIVQYHVDQVHNHGGEPILNHPNFRWALSFDDLMPVKNLGMFELYNGHPHVHNDGDHEHHSTEVLWDKLLTEGKRLYGVSSDDAHWFAERKPELSNPGRGWVMVKAQELNADAITASMRNGAFYSSNGVILNDVRVEDGKYIVEVDLEKTHKEVQKGFVVGKKTTQEVGSRVDFISANGEIVASTSMALASFPLSKANTYLRAKVTFTVQTKLGKRSYFAWTQPIFR